MLGNKSKRILAVVLSAAMLLPMASLTACKKKAKVEVPTVKETDPFFEVTEVECQVPIDSAKELESLWIERDTVHFVGDNITMNCEFYYKIPPEVEAKMQELRNDEKWDELLELSSEYQFSKMAYFDLNGNLLRMTDVKFDTEFDETVYEEWVQTTFENDKGETLGIVKRPEGAYLEKMVGDGSTEQIMPLENVNALDVVPLSDGRLVCSAYEQVTVLDADGKELGTQYLYDEHFQGKVYYQDGKCYAQCYEIDYDDFDNSYVYFQELDVNNLCLVGEKHRNTHNGQMVKAGNGNYILNKNGIIKTNLLDSKNDQEVFSWSNTDYASRNGNLIQEEVRILSDKEFYFLRFEYGTADDSDVDVNKVHITHAVAAEKNPYAGKKILTVGAYDSSLSQEDIVRYNTSENAACRIVTHDYAEDINMEGDVMNKNAEFSDKLYLDIVSGKGPDILVNFSQFTQFNSNEVLIDLNTWIDADSGKGLDRSMYFDNILRAMEVGGKLYHMPLEFIISGMAGNPALGASERSWTYDDFTSEMATLPSDISIWNDMEYTDLLEWIMSETGEHFVDYAAKEVHFEDEAFKKMLTFVKQYGFAQTDSESMDGYEQFKSGMQVWYPMWFQYIGIFAQFIRIYGSDKIFCGLPGSTGGSLSAQMKVTVGISKYTPCQEEAWDFIRFLLETQENSNMLDMEGMPISRKALDTQNSVAIASSKEKMATWEPDPQNPDNRPIEINEEMASTLVRYVESVHVVKSSDPRVMLIILEEAPAYFLDQKSLDDVCRNIQNRTKNLVQER